MHLKPKKLLKYPQKLKNNPNDPKTLNKFKNTLKTYKMTKIPHKT